MRGQTALLAWALALVVTPGVLFLWRYQTRRDLINVQNQRDLGHAARNLEKILSNNRGTVENLVRRPAPPTRVELEVFTEQQPYLEEIGGSGRADLEDWCPEPERGVREVGARQSLPGKGGTNHKFSSTLCSDRLQLAVVGRHDSKPYPFVVQLEAILADLPIGRAFEYLLVADGAGDVLVEIQRGRRQEWLEQLGRAAHLRTRKSTAPADLLVRTLEGLQLADDQGVEFEALARASGRNEVRLAGRDYELFSQPVLLDGYEPPEKSDQERPSGRTWVLCGLVSVEETRRQALSVGPAFTVILTLALVFGVLSWPFVKLATLKRRERLKDTDVYMLAVATSWAMALVTILLVHSDSRLDASNRAADRLTKLASAVELSLIEELQSMYRQLKTYDASLAREHGVCCDDFRQTANLLVPPEQRQAHRDEANGLRLPPPSEHPDLHSSVFWVRPDGWQVAKATILSANTAAVNVSSRPYFSEVRAERTWDLLPGVVGESEELDWKVFVQPFRSITTGRLGTALSTMSENSCSPLHMNAGKTDRPDDRLVAVISTAPLSLTDALLPAGYGFAIVNRSGTVLFHSDPKRALGVDLFEEVEEPQRLQAAILAEATTVFDTDYLTAPHEMHIRPLLGLTGSDWFVVTFRDRQVLGTLSGESIGSTLIWLSLLVLVCQLVPSAIGLCCWGRRAPWLWPDPRQIGRNWDLAVRYGLLIAMTASAISLFSGNLLLFAVFASALAANVIPLGKGKSWPWSGRLARSVRGLISDRGGHRETVLVHSLVTTELLLLVSVLPAVGLFKAAWSDQVLRWSAAEGARFEREVEQRRARTAQIYREVLVPRRKEFLMSRASRDRIRYERTFGSNRASESGRRLWLGLERWRPAYNEASARLRYQTPAAPGNLDEEIGLGPWFWLGLPAMLIGVVRWQGYTAHRLFFLGLDGEHVRRDPIALLRATDSANVVFRVCSARDESEVCKRLEQEVPQPRGDSAEAKRARPAEAGLSVVCGLDLALGDRAARLTKLGRLERLLSQPGRVVIVSTVDPFAYLAGETAIEPQASPDANGDSREVDKAPARGETQKFDGVERRRWERVLETFRLETLAANISQPESEVDEAVDPATGLAARGVDSVLGRNTVADARLGARRLAQGRGRFQSIWSSCSIDERLVLVQIAQEGFANPKQEPTVRGLMRRGLVVRDPELRLFSRGFRAFVECAQDAEEVTRWERSARGFGWKQMKWILAILLVGVAVFLTSTQADTLDRTAGILSAAAALLGAVLRLTVALSRKGLSTAP